MKTQKNILLAAIIAASTGAANAVTIANFSSATASTINGGAFDGAGSVTNADSLGGAGTNGTTRYFHQFGAYRVSDILTAIGSTTIADIALYTFTYTGITEASAINIADTSFYQVAYVGQWENTGALSTDVPTSGVQNMGDSPTASANSRTLFSNAADAIGGYTGFGGTGAPVQSINTNTFDLADTAQTLSGSGFDLSGLATSLAADPDLSNNYVFFSFYLDPFAPTADGQGNQLFSSITLEAIANPVPEPSTALLGGLGMLALLRRRRD